MEARVLKLGSTVIFPHCMAFYLEEVDAVNREEGWGGGGAKEIKSETRTILETISILYSS